MYKNFNLNDEERKQIMEMHKLHGYKKPLNEESINLDTYNGDKDIITEISLISVSEDGNPITKIILKSGLSKSENKNLIESTNITVICEWMLMGEKIPYSRGHNGTYFVIKNVIDIKSDVPLNELENDYVKNIFKKGEISRDVIGNIYIPYIRFLNDKKSDYMTWEDKQIVNKIFDYSFINKNKLDDFLFMTQKNVKKNKKQPIYKKKDSSIDKNSPIDKKSMWTSTNTWSSK
jgi:hypothetical protein